MTTSVSLVFGIDGGGTGCRAEVCSLYGEQLGIGEAGPANVMTNYCEARNNIIQACLAALENASISKTAIGGSSALLGIAGANIGSTPNVLADDLPFKKCCVVNDVEIALEGAIGRQDGVVAVMGTGSVFAARNDQKIHVIGGWGSIVGDLGSGARIGRELLQEALLAHDGVRDFSPITTKVLTDFKNNPKTIVEYAHSASPGDFGQFAPLVLEYVNRGDLTARKIWIRAVRSVEEALDSMISNRRTKLCLLGGLGQRYAISLSSKFAPNLKPPEGTALDGAVRLAIRQFADTRTHGLGPIYHMKN